MIRVYADSAPSSLIQVVRSSPSDPDAPPVTYDGLPGHVKDDIRAKLHEAQQGRCAYCETRIPLDSDFIKIEHFHPQKPSKIPTIACEDRTRLPNALLPKADVTWLNLLLCCKGNAGASSNSATCDARKGNTDICQSFYNPRALDSNHEALATVSFDGRVIASYYPTDPTSAQRVIDEVLHLNMQLFVDNRRRVWSNYLEQFKVYKKYRAGKISMAQLRTNFADKVRNDARTGSEYASTLMSIASHIESSRTGSP